MNNRPKFKKLDPWTFGDVEDGRVYIDDIADNHYAFAEVVLQMDESKFQNPAFATRAKFIVKAPELYNALKALTLACLDQDIKLGLLIGDAEEVLSYVEEKGPI